MSTPTTATRSFQPGPETYEHALVPILFRPWGERVIEVAQPRTGERVLDVACGTGILARLAAAHVGPGGRVVGVDINPAMLEVARAIAPEPDRVTGALDATSAIEWDEGDAVALPYEDATFDLALCQQGVQFTSDKAATFAEMRRVLAPRGRAVIAVWRGADANPGLIAFGEALARHLPDDATDGVDAPFSYGDPEVIRTALRDAGFSQIHISLEVRPVRYASAEHMLAVLGGAFAPMGAAIDALDADARAALIADVTETLRSNLDDDGVVDPMAANLILARP